MESSALRTALEMCGEDLPRTDLSERLLLVKELLERMDEEVRRNLEPSATEFLTSLAFYWNPGTIPWEELRDREDLEWIRPSLESLREAIQVIPRQNTGARYGILKRYLVTVPHEALKIAIHVELARIRAAERLTVEM